MIIMVKNKLWLVIKDSRRKGTWIRYFDEESEMNKFINKIKWIKELFIVEDSRDIVWR